MRNSLKELSQTIKKRNLYDREIASIINRPAQTGHIGEFIAAEIFGIELEKSASHKGSDGTFRHGPLAGHSVNIKWSLKHDGLLNLSPESPPDYYLVMTGPKTGAVSSRGTSRALCIEYVFLFRASELYKTLRERGVKIGTAASVVNRLWDKAEVYPSQNNAEMILTDEQQKQLALFAPSLVDEEVPGSALLP